ncbi:fasciclin domain-containing protein [uncultured Kriegella sp.]|uniref:fasciclin domain-containing protein n=1 Tax=uncultured Kriegella sp. TaxID=1798910 RepID=UPI0030DC3A27|tara:strand:- start:61705 stop:63219 length:1515 start_codon:yes stop_codon:yes gene_type:complete
MKKVLLQSKILFAALLLSLTISCSSDDDTNMEQETSLNIVELAQNESTLSNLVAALQQADAGLVETLSGNGPFTVFAPSNDAFSDLLDALGENYNSLADFDEEAEKNLLRDILLYHVLSSQVMAADLTQGNVSTALSGSSIEVIASGSTFVLGDASSVNANITGTDIMASNGVVHLIDKVLLPQSAIDFVTELNSQNIPKLAMATDDLSLLVDALVQADADLVATLSGDGPFTVFAPTNAAFAALLDDLGDEYNSLADFDTEDEKTLLAKILTYHVVGSAALSTDLSEGQEIETVQGENIVVSLVGGVFTDDATDENAQVILADQMASNGVVHVVDKVLLPQEVLDALKPNMVELAQAVDDLSLLVEALVQADADLVATLSGDGPFTVFAPTNAAFAALLDDLGDEYNSLGDFDTEAEKELLTKILTYHVVATSALSADLSDGQEIETVQGENVIISLHGGVFIDDATNANAEVILADQMAKNGVAHIVDKVLLPQEVLDLLGH